MFVQLKRTWEIHTNGFQNNTSRESQMLDDNTPRKHITPNLHVPIKKISKTHGIKGENMKFLYYKWHLALIKIVIDSSMQKSQTLRRKQA